MRHAQEPPDFGADVATDWIALYLEEDLGPGDVTSDAIFAADDKGSARVVARERMFVAGLEAAADVFARLGCSTLGPAGLDESTAVTPVHDGTWVEAGTTLMWVNGPVRGILAAERLALNLLGRMSGIAANVRSLADELEKTGSAARVAGTRKTTPGFRSFEKEAIRIGGGDPHRMGLYDEAMVKDNHREAAGGIAAAVERVRLAHPRVPLTAEVESEEDARSAARAGADWLLIDNQEPSTGRMWAKRVRQEHPRVKIEASGGITEETLLDHAWADRISMGSLTTRAHCADVSLEWGP